MWLSLWKSNRHFLKQPSEYDERTKRVGLRDEEGQVFLFARIERPVCFEDKDDL